MIEAIGVAVVMLLVWLKFINNPRQRKIGAAKEVVADLNERADEIELQGEDLETLEALRDNLDPVDPIANVDDAIDFVDDFLRSRSDRQD